jgi:hypothetical protein
MAMSCFFQRGKSLLKILSRHWDFVEIIIMFVRPVAAPFAK